MGDWASFVREHLRHAADDQARENDIIEELAQHLAQREAELVSGGLEPDAARRRVIEELPEWQRLAGEIRRADRARPMAVPLPPHRRGNPLAALWRDVVYAIRSLRKSPTYTTVALTVLALGIGSATAIFSVVDAVVLRGLPYDEHDRLVVVLEHRTGAVPVGNPFGEGTTTPQTYLDWRAQQQSFETLAAVTATSVGLRDAEGHPQPVRAIRATADFFRVLRVAPMLGRAFTTAEETVGRHRVAILSYGLWQRRFGGSRDVIGRTIALDDESFEVVGVMPLGCAYPVASATPTDLYVPLSFPDQVRVRGGVHNNWYTAIGRLRPGVSMAQASDQMNRVAAALDAQYPEWEPGLRVRLETLHEHLVGRVRSWMVMLLGAVALLLLIACGNAANLMLARATARGAELAIRSALGASRAAIVRGLLVESVLLSLGGGALGVLLAWAGVRAIIPWLPAGIPRVADIGMDLRVLAASAGAALISGIGFGLIPALRTSQPNLSTALQDSSRSSTSGPGSRRLRSALVVTEVALAVMLVVGAGLFVGSFAKLMRVDPGFDYRRVLVVRVGATYQPGMDVREARRRCASEAVRMLEAVRHVPGVQASATVSDALPLEGTSSTSGIRVPGRGVPTGDDRWIHYRIVTPGYHELLRIPLVRGRHLTPQDRADGQRVVIVNHAAAQKYWQGEDPLGQRVVMQGKEWVVVGIVGDVRHGGPETVPTPECYFSLAQNEAWNATLLVRTSGDPLRTLPAVKAAVWSVSMNQRIDGDIFTLEGYMDRLVAQRRFIMTLFALFGVLGLVISAVGVYGVMAYLVAQRTSEIGLRIALGATPGSVVAMVLRRAGALVGRGLAVGSVVALYASRFARSFLFQLEPNDPRIFAAALTVLALAGLVASVVPARRAAAVDPIVALKRE